MIVVRMASLLIAAFLVVLQPTMSAAAEDIPTEPTYLYRAVVARVVDGDTIDVDIDLGFYVWIRISAFDSSGSMHLRSEARPARRTGGH